MKQVDILSICPETGKRIALEICHSTFDTEPDQALCDLREGADAVILVCPTRPALDKLRDEFIKRMGTSPDARITLVMPCHLATAPSFRHVHECPHLVYNPKWDRKIHKNKCPGGARI